MPQCGKLPHLPPKNTAVKRILRHKSTTGKCMEFPVWNELFTFSTGFSTWKSGFAYTSRNAARRFMPVSGKKSGHFAFYIKESRRIFFSFYSLFRLTIRSLSRLEKRSPEFSTERERRFFVWKKRGKLRFSTVCRRSPAESAPHAVFAPECVRNRAIACVPSRSVPSKKLPPSRFTP